MNIKVKKLHKDAKLPTRGSDYSAGYDLYAVIEEEDNYTHNGVAYTSIPPHQCRKIRTGLAIEFPSGYFGGIFARSGLATKQGLRPSNCVGICDEDFKGEIMVALHNDTDSHKTVNHGDRIAQLVLLPYLSVTFEEGELSESSRGVGGFGSTGTN